MINLFFLFDLLKIPGSYLRALVTFLWGVTRFTRGWFVKASTIGLSDWPWN